MIHHLLRNAAPILLTLWGQNIGYLIAGTAIVENIFSIPCIGMYALNAAVNRDFPVINAYLVVTGFPRCLFKNKIYRLLHPVCACSYFADKKGGVHVGSSGVFFADASGKICNGVFLH